MFRPDRILAAATIALWAASASAEPPQPGEGATQPGAAQTAPPAPQNPVPAPQVQPATPPVAQPATPAVVPPAATAVVPPAAQQGTPATVLDVQDYESLLGKGVRSANGDELGRVIDIIIDKDGRPRAAIIDFGGFLGVGTRKIAVDWRALRFTTDGKPGRLSLQLSRNQVRVSPEYKAGEPIVVLGPASPSAEGAEVPGAAPQAQAQPPQPAVQPQAAQPAPAQPGAQTTPPAPVQSAPQPAVEKPPEKAPDK